MRINQDAARRAGIQPQENSRTLRLLIDGETIAEMQDQGEELEVRVRAKPTLLTLFVVPLLYRISMCRRQRTGFY